MSTPSDALLAKVARVIGYVPIGTKDLLNVLTHPDVLPLTRAFLDAQDTEQKAGNR